VPGLFDKVSGILSGVTGLAFQEFMFVNGIISIELVSTATYLHSTATAVALPAYPSRSPLQVEVNC